MSISQNVMTENTMSNPSAFETLRKAADRYVNSGKPLSITAHSICKSISKSVVMSRLEIESYNPLNRSIGPYIIDIRDFDTEMPDAYFLGHIPGAVHIPWRKLTQLKTLNSLPKDRQIVVYSSTGQTGGQAAAILSLLGFDAVNLKWGITSWTDDAAAAPARYSPEKDILWQNESYRSTVTNNLEPDIRYDVPEIAVEGRTPESIIWSAADEYLRQYKVENISAGSLYDPLFAILHPLYVSPYEEPDKDMLVLPFGVQPGEHDESFTWPFILDVRTETEYAQGHIPACVHIPFTELFSSNNVRKLPPDRQIVVVSNTGHTSAHIAALLNLLGYDAVNLKWGMSGWCSPEKLNITDSYSIDRDCMKYPVVKGWNPGKAAECKG